MNTRNMALIALDAAFLREALHLRPDTIIHGCMKDDLGTILLKIEHPDLRPVPEGNQVTVVRPRFRRVPAQSERVEFDNLGRDGGTMPRIHIAAPRGGPLDVMDDQGGHVHIHDLYGKLLRVHVTTNDELVVEVQSESPLQFDPRVITGEDELIDSAEPPTRTPPFQSFEIRG